MVKINPDKNEASILLTYSILTASDSKQNNILAKLLAFYNGIS
jgi:hypothetical protein